MSNNFKLWLLVYHNALAKPSGHYSGTEKVHVKLDSLILENSLLMIKLNRQTNTSPCRGPSEAPPSFVGEARCHDINTNT